jgi:hypothetical protein
MDYFHDFYRRVFNFHEHQYFDITGEYTGLTSRALASPAARSAFRSTSPSTRAGAIRSIRFRSSSSSIAARASSTWRCARTISCDLGPPARERREVHDAAAGQTYYEMLEERVPGHGGRRRGASTARHLVGRAKGRFLLQIFTETLIGPIFFEIIERRGDDGFGQGNFRALFVSMERDQLRRGVLKAPPAGAERSPRAPHRKPARFMAGLPGDFVFESRVACAARSAPASRRRGRRCLPLPRRCVALRRGRRSERGGARELRSLLDPKNRPGSWTTAARAPGLAVSRGARVRADGAASRRDVRANRRCEILALSAPMRTEDGRAHRLAFPGFFRKNTHRMGSYVGVRVAASWWPWAESACGSTGHPELSGICTHPAHRGKGSRAISSGISRGTIDAKAWCPGCTSALPISRHRALYASLGFERVRNIMLHRITRTG